MQSNKKASGPICLFIAVAGLLWSAGACAADQVKPVLGVGGMPEHKLFAAAETDLPIRLKPGKYQTVRLPSEMASAVVDDMPGNVTAVPYARDTVALYPHAMGAAHVTVRGKDGTVLMARYVIVEDPAQKYIRLHLACRKGETGGCEKTVIYYCPNFCYQTHVVEAGKALVSK